LVKAAVSPVPITAVIVGTAKFFLAVAPVAAETPTSNSPEIVRAMVAEDVRERNIGGLSKPGVSHKTLYFPKV
jgi:hypothetical protein